jgi:hypothetical protein
MYLKEQENTMKESNAFCKRMLELSAKAVIVLCLPK